MLSIIIVVIVIEISAGGLFSFVLERACTIFTVLGIFSRYDYHYTTMMCDTGFRKKKLDIINIYGRPIKINLFFKPRCVHDKNYVGRTENGLCGRS